MVITIAAFVLSASAAPATPVMDTSQLPETFVAACLDGKATLSDGEAWAVGVDELPPELRRKLGKPASGQAWQLQTAGRAYLYVLTYDAGQADDAKICGLASETMSLKVAADAVEKRMTAYIGSERLEGMQWLMPKDGYVATVTKAGDFNVAQINWLSEIGRAALSRKVRHVTP